MQKKAMNVTFWRFPIECSRMIEIGSRAGGGIARQYSMCGIANLRDHADSPSGMPSATPSTTAIAKPSKMRSRLGTTSARNCAKSQRSWNSRRIVDGGGKYWLSAEAAHGCHAARIAIGTAISAPILSREGRAGSRASSRCEGCHRSARRSSVVKARCVPRPRAPGGRARERRAAS